MKVNLHIRIRKDYGYLEWPRAYRCTEPVFTNLEKARVTGRTALGHSRQRHASQQRA
jgi:hypothetical protein